MWCVSLTYQVLRKVLNWPVMLSATRVRAAIESFEWSASAELRARVDGAWAGIKFSRPPLDLRVWVRCVCGWFRSK